MTLDAVAMEPAEARDATAIVELRDRVAEWLLARGVRQWLPGEFGHDRMVSWIDDGRVFVLRRHGRITAAVAVLRSDPQIWGELVDGEEAGYVHLLMVEPDRIGQRLGRSVLGWAEEFVKTNGRRVARLDVVTDNDRLQRWYAQRGYVAVGERCFEDEAWFDTTLLEKRL